VFEADTRVREGRRCAISIIVPIFDVEDFIEPCLESLVAQDFELPHEVLLVDDGSPDGSREICHRYVDRHPDLFRLICNPENRGVSVARNRGLDCMVGDYCLFVDPDDTLPDTALTSLYGAAALHGSQIVKGNNSEFDDRRTRRSRQDVRRPRSFYGDQVLTVLLRHEIVRGHPWGKLYTAALVERVRFSAGVRLAQDLLFNAEVFAAASSFTVITDTVYHYRIRQSGSKGRKYDAGSYRDWLHTLDHIAQFASSRRQRAALHGLRIRCLLQLLRECAKLPPERAWQPVMDAERFARTWKCDSAMTLFHSPLGVSDFVRYFRGRRLMGALQRTTALRGSTRTEP
jgi:glycosyltransferase involved in cell wall biosynthesis